MNRLKHDPRDLEKMSNAQLSAIIIQQDIEKLQRDQILYDFNEVKDGSDIIKLYLNDEAKERRCYCNRLHLYICTLFPDVDAIPWQVKTNMDMFKEVGKLNDTFHPVFIWVEGGYFTHRHTRTEQDEIQCRLRQKYIDTVPDGEWMFVIDADEVVLGSPYSVPVTLYMWNQISPTSPQGKTRVMNFACCWEMRADIKFKQRPRFIKKKRGISYVSEVMKHDYIKDGDSNYIEVQRPVNEEFLTMDYLAFAHYKQGEMLSFVSDGLLEFDQLPENFHRYSDTQMFIDTLSDADNWKTRVTKGVRT